MVILPAPTEPLPLYVLGVLGLDLLPWPYLTFWGPTMETPTHTLPSVPETHSDSDVSSHRPKATLERDPYR